MEVRFELAALTRDLVPLRRAQACLAAALAEWREARGDAWERALAAFAQGADPRDLPPLAKILAPDFDGAPIAALVTSIAAILAENPLGLVPLRHHCDDGMASLVLARAGGASLSLQALDGSALAPPPPTISFAPTETWDRVLAGHADVETIAAVPVGPDLVALTAQRSRLAPGAVCCRDGRTEAQTYLAIDPVLVVLRLQRRHPGALPTLEYRRADGVLVHRAAGNPRDSRFELVAALLGAMERGDAAPTLAAIAREGGTASMRWQALRQALALDSARGFAALTDIAADPDDALAAPAGALLAQLRVLHPELAACPA